MFEFLQKGQHLFQIDLLLQFSSKLARPLQSVLYLWQVGTQTWDILRCWNNNNEAYFLENLSYSSAERVVPQVWGFESWNYFQRLVMMWAGYRVKVLILTTSLRLRGQG